MGDQYVQFDKEKVSDANTQKVRSNIIKKRLDILVQDDSQHGFWRDKTKYRVKCFLRNVIVLLYNSGPVYPVYLLASIYQLFEVIKKPKEDGFSLKQYFIYFVIDFLLCFAVNCMFLCFLRGNLAYESMNDLGKEYFHWSINCIIFIQLYSFFTTEKLLTGKREDEIEKSKKAFIKKKDQKLESNESEDKYIFDFDIYYFVSEFNFTGVGLGRMSRKYLKEEHNKHKNMDERIIKHLDREFEKIVEEENIDSTLMYFALLNDADISPDIKKSMMHSVEDEFEKHMLDHLIQLGFKGKRHILENFLKPHYIYTRKYTISNPQLRWFVVGLCIIMKIIIPTTVLISPINAEVLIYSLIFTGFYMHFMSMLFELVLNDDLKTKTYLFMSLMQILSIKDYATNSNMIDISCALSLQSWDTMRHMVLKLDKRKTRSINYLLGFLVLYGKLCFIAFMVCNFNFGFLKHHNYCKETVLLYNIHIDIALIVAICLVRIHEGDRFNATFQEIRDVIHRLTAVYEDLFTLFEFYFSQGLADIMDQSLYIFVIQLIQKYTDIKVRNQEMLENSQSQKQETGEASFAIESEKWMISREKIEEMKESMQKISEGVDEDEERYKDKFLGHMETSFKLSLRIAVLVAVSFVPNLFHKISKYLNEMT